ncbi:MAG: threonine/homoserine/homoserine lactone efflux protein [Paracoccaceae bacterium]
MAVDLWVLLAFLPAAIALNLTPGADMMFCFSQGLRRGSKAAITASLGISTGGLVHVTLAGLGLSALISTVPWLFGAIRWFGVAYLLWLAWSNLHAQADPRFTTSAKIGRSFWDGFVVNMSNPKVILFILAFIPQFVDPSRNVLAQFLTFGAVLAIGGFVINSLVGILSGRFRQSLARNAPAERVLRYLSSGVFVALAIKLGWDGVKA